jgi:hypothetical protein
MTMGMDSSGSSPRLCHSVKVRNAASTANAPWARLITRMTPKIRVRPDAIRAYSAPTSTPRMSVCTRDVMRVGS